MTSPERVKEEREAGTLPADAGPKETGNSAFNHYDGHDLVHHLLSPPRRSATREFDYRELSVDEKFHKMVEERKRTGFFESILEGTPEHDQRMKEVCVAYARGLHEDRATLFRNQGIANAKAFGFREAISCYNRALEMSAHSPSRHITLAYRSSAYMKTDMFAEALADAEEAAALRPDYAAAYSLVGYCKQHFGRLKDAIESYGKSLRLNPTDQSTRELWEEARRALASSAVAQANPVSTRQIGSTEVILTDFWDDPDESEAYIKHRRYLDGAARACSLQDMVHRASTADDARLLTPGELLASVLSPPRKLERGSVLDEHRGRPPRSESKRSAGAQALSSLVQHLPNRLKSAMGSSKRRGSAGRNGLGNSPENSRGNSRKGPAARNSRSPDKSFTSSPFERRLQRKKSGDVSSPPANSMNIPSPIDTSHGRVPSPPANSLDFSTPPREISRKIPPPLSIPVDNPSGCHPEPFAMDSSPNVWTSPGRDGGGGQAPGGGPRRDEEDSFANFLGATPRSFLTPPHAPTRAELRPPAMFQRVGTDSLRGRVQHPSMDSACMIDEEYVPMNTRPGAVRGVARDPEAPMEGRDVGAEANDRRPFGDDARADFSSGGGDSAAGPALVAAASDVSSPPDIIGAGVNVAGTAFGNEGAGDQRTGGTGAVVQPYGLHSANNPRTSADRAMPRATEGSPARNSSAGTRREGSGGGVASPDTVTYNDEKLPPPPRPKTPPIYHVPLGGCPGAPMRPGLVSMIERRMTTGYYGNPDDTPERAPYLDPERVLELRKDGSPPNDPPPRIDPGNGRWQVVSGQYRPVWIGNQEATGVTGIHNRTAEVEEKSESNRTAREPRAAGAAGKNPFENPGDDYKDDGDVAVPDERGDDREEKNRRNQAAFAAGDRESKGSNVDGQLYRDRDGYLCVRNSRNLGGDKRQSAFADHVTNSRGKTGPASESTILKILRASQSAAGTTSTEGGVHDVAHKNHVSRGGHSARAATAHAACDETDPFEDCWVRRDQPHDRVYFCRKNDQDNHVVNHKMTAAEAELDRFFRKGQESSAQLGGMLAEGVPEPYCDTDKREAYKECDQAKHSAGNNGATGNVPVVKVGTCVANQGIDDVEGSATDGKLGIVNKVGGTTHDKRSITRGIEDPGDEGGALVGGIGIGDAKGAKLGTTTEKMSAPDGKGYGNHKNGHGIEGEEGLSRPDRLIEKRNGGSTSATGEITNRTEGLTNKLNATGKSDEVGARLGGTGDENEGSSHESEGSSDHPGGDVLARVTDWVKATHAYATQHSPAEAPRNNAALSELIRDGTILVSIVNAIKSGIATSASEDAVIFSTDARNPPEPSTLDSDSRAENLTRFLRACVELGISSEFHFSESDLVCDAGLGRVVRCLEILGTVASRNVPGYSGPILQARRDLV